MGLQKRTITIPAGQTTSNAVYLDCGLALIKIDFPVMTGAQFFLQESQDGSIFKDSSEMDGKLYFPELSMGISNTSYIFGKRLLIFIGFLRVVSTSIEAADRSIDLFFADMLG
jgi:hypothetical protein